MQKLYTLRHNANVVTCDNSHVVSFKDLGLAVKASRAMKSTYAITTYTTNPVYARKIDEYWKGRLVGMGVCPERLADVKSREVTFTLDKMPHVVDLGIDEQPLIEVNDIHPYTLFSLALYDKVPIAIVDDIIDEHPEMLCMSGIVIDAPGDYKMRLNDLRTI